MNVFCYPTSTYKTTHVYFLLLAILFPKLPFHEINLMKKLITFVAMFLFLGCFFFNDMQKRVSHSFEGCCTSVLRNVIHCILFILYVYLSFSCFTFNRYWLTEKFSLLFFFGFHFFHHSAQEFSYFIFFIVYLKLLLLYFWQDRYSNFPFDLQKIFLFFFFGFAQEMKYFVWTWFSTTIWFSNLSMWIKSFFCKLQLAAI